MKITEVQIRLLRNPTSKLVAFASLTFDNELVIKDFRIFVHEKRVSVGMPSRKLPDGSWSDLIFPISTELADSIQSTIRRAFDDERSRPENQHNPAVK